MTKAIGGLPPAARQLISASEHADIQRVKRLLDAGGCESIGLNEALGVAARLGFTGIMKLLLNAGSDVHAFDDVALRSAAR